MEHRKYVVCRDNIYVGEVVRTSRIHRYEGDSAIFNTKPGQLSVGSWFSYRSMLFTPDENGLSDDLLYRSPNYPVLNVTDDDTCLNLGDNSIIVKDACNLAVLLKYFGYKQDLTYEDIVKIRKTFFTGRFAKDNCELFGWKETMAEDITFYSYGEIVTDPRELEKRRREYRAEQKTGHRSFTGISEHVLPREYWDILDDRGDNTIMDILQGWSTRLDSFAPPKQEGKIRKLSRF